MKEQMSLKRWYGSRISIPNYGSWRFIDFAVSGLGIVGSIVREQMGKSIRVWFMRGGSAHANWDNMTIGINEDYLKGNLGAGYPALNSDEALTLIMGLQVHESAHFAWSPKTGEPWVNYVKEHTPFPFMESIAMMLGNIVEDIYIEAEVDREIPGLTWMLDVMNDIFFSSFRESETMAEAAHITAAPCNLLDVAKALNVLIFAKTRTSVETSPLLANLFCKVREATETSYLSQRNVITLEVYNALMAEISQEECDSASEESEEDGEGSEVAQALGESERRSKGFTSWHGKAKVPETEESRTTTAQEISKSLLYLQDAKISLETEDAENEASGVYIEKGVGLNRTHPAIVGDVRYRALLEIARQRSTVNRPYGLDKSRGHSMRKIYRIATDSKIFAETVVMSTYQPMEVVILIDCSGSMTVCGSKKTVSRIHEAVVAALGAAEALVEARCSVAVYGHSADCYMGNETLIYRVKTFNEPASVLAPRLTNLLYDEEKSENRDGNAIHYIAKKFSRGGKRKLLIVISDGAPEANRYKGEPAIEHTRRSVEKVRKSGIDVLSISITLEAKVSNDLIYGRKHNTYNRDVNVIADIVRSLIVN
jgi:hypothetical protein